MATPTRLRVVGTIAILLAACSNRAHAGELERIRPQSPLLRTAMTAASERSQTFRSLINRIEQSDIIVYLTCEDFGTSTLSGRTLLTSAGPDVRYLRVQIRCQQSVHAVAAIVAHELQHVVEIASRAAVVDGRSFERLFSAIGFATCRAPHSERFETTAALETGERVYSELGRRAEGVAQVIEHAAWRSDRRAVRRR